MIQSRLIAGLLFILLAQGVFSKNISLDVDATKTSFKVRLAANPTTGYTWKLIGYDKNILNMSGVKYISQDDGLIGSGGMRVYTFDLKNTDDLPKTTRILFRYSRSWDKTTGEDTEVKVHFKNTSTSPPIPH